MLDYQASFCYMLPTIIYSSAIVVHYPDDLLWDVQGHHKTACKPTNHSLLPLPLFIAPLPFHHHTAPLSSAAISFFAPPSQTGYEIDFEHLGNETDDRQTLYCVPIPAETTWAKAISSL